MALLEWLFQNADNPLFYVVGTIGLCLTTFVVKLSEQAALAAWAGIERQFQRKKSK